MIGQSEFSRVSLNIENSRGPYAVTGCLPSFAAGRVAYALGLRGPTHAVNGACSSSLVAIHTASRALQRHDCDMALAEG